MGAAFSQMPTAGAATPYAGYDPNSVNTQLASGYSPTGGVLSYQNPNMPHMGGFNQSFPFMPQQPLFGSKGYYPMQQQYSMMPNYLGQNTANTQSATPYANNLQNMGFARGGRVLLEDDPIKEAQTIVRDKLRG